MLTKSLAALGLSLALGFAFWTNSATANSSPCACCGTECVCTDCACDALGCACDSGGDCVCDPVPCCSSCRF